MLKTNYTHTPQVSILLTLVCLLSLILFSCTKYVAKNSSQATSNSTNNSTGYTPSNGNNGSSASGGNTSSGGSSSGGSTGSGTGGSSTGGNTGGNSSSGSSNGTGNTIPKTYIQSFNYSTLINSGIYANDSIALLASGYYTILNAGSNKFALVWGNHNAIFLNNYSLNPYSFYSYFVFDETPTTLGEMMLSNGTLTVPTNVALVRFINIDPTTKNNSITFKLNNGNDKITIPNRGYLDNKTDSSLAPFIGITPSTAAIDFEVNGQVIKSFNQYFQGGKKYTVAAAFSKQYSYSTYFVTQHN